MSAEAASPFQALADPTRRAILALLRSGSRTAGEIAEAIPSLSKPTLSHHFRVLTAAGLVRAERRGTFIVYTLQTNVLEDLAAQILNLTQELRASTNRTESGSDRLVQTGTPESAQNRDPSLPD